MQTALSHPQAHAHSPRPAPRRSRVALISAAGRMLETTSYDALCLEHVAAEAGVSRRTVYNQFGHKEELYRSLIEPEILAVASQLNLDIPDGPRPRDAMWLFSARTALVLAGEKNVHVVRCVIRDGGQLPWLRDAYARHVRLPILTAVELWLLRNRPRESSVQPAEVAAFAAQFLFLLEGVTTAPHLQPTPNVQMLQIAGEQALDTIVAAFLQRAGIESTH